MSAGYPAVRTAPYGHSKTTGNETEARICRPGVRPVKSEVERRKLRTSDYRNERATRNYGKTFKE
jgi:hypothetical protein